MIQTIFDTSSKYTKKTLLNTFISLKKDPGKDVDTSAKNVSDMLVGKQIPCSSVPVCHKQVGNIAMLKTDQRI